MGLETLILAFEKDVGQFVGEVKLAEIQVILAARWPLHVVQFLRAKESLRLSINNQLKIKS